MRMYVLHFPNPPGLSGCSMHTTACWDYRRREPDAATFWSRPIPFAWLAAGLVRMYAGPVKRCDRCLGAFLGGQQAPWRHIASWHSVRNRYARVLIARRQKW